MAQHVKIIEDIPEEDLEAMISVHKNDGAQVAYIKQPNGKFRIEAIFEEKAPPQQDTVRSVISGQDLRRA